MEITPQNKFGTEEASILQDGVEIKVGYSCSLSSFLFLGFVVPSLVSLFLSVFFSATSEPAGCGPGKGVWVFLWVGECCHYGLSHTLAHCAGDSIGSSLEFLVAVSNLFEL